MFIPLIQKMFDGIIGKNQQEIPAGIKVVAKEFPDSKFRHADKLSLVIFTTKTTKNCFGIVILYKDNICWRETEARNDSTL